MSEPAPPPPELDPVIEAYKKDVDATLLDENLRLTPAERLRKLMAFCRFLDGIRGAAARGGAAHGAERQRTTAGAPR